MRRRKQRILAGTAATSLMATGGAILAMEIGRRLFRRAQLFCPERNPVISWNPADYGVDPSRVKEQWFETADGERLYGWYCESQQPIASALFCHGNTGNLTTVATIIPFLLEAGCNVLFFDYRGFGRSSGSPTLGGVVSDGLTAARFHDRLRPKHLPSILYGYSLGGAIAAKMIGRHPFDGLVLQSTFTSLPDIARFAFPRLPMHLLAGRFFDTLSVVRHLRIPLLVLHGTADEAVPCWMGHAIYEACTSTKKIYTVPGALHKDMFEREPDMLVRTIHEFASELPKHAEPVSAPDVSPAELVLDSALRFVRRTIRRNAAARVLAGPAQLGTPEAGGASHGA